jgi:hypothetical protein
VLHTLGASTQRLDVFGFKGASAGKSFDWA